MSKIRLHCAVDAKPAEPPRFEIWPKMDVRTGKAQSTSAAPLTARGWWCRSHTDTSRVHSSHAGAPPGLRVPPPVRGFSFFSPCFHSPCMGNGRENRAHDVSITQHTSHLCLFIIIYHPEKELFDLATFNLCFSRPMVFVHVCAHQQVPRRGQACIRHWKTRARSRDCKWVLHNMECVLVVRFVWFALVPLSQWSIFAFLKTLPCECLLGFAVADYVWHDLCTMIDTLA